MPENTPGPAARQLHPEDSTTCTTAQHGQGEHSTSRWAGGKDMSEQHHISGSTPAVIILHPKIPSEGRSSSLAKRSRTVSMPLLPACRSRNGNHHTNTSQLKQPQRKLHEASTAVSCCAIHSQLNTEFPSFCWIPGQSNYTWMENINSALPRSRKYHNGNCSSSAGTKQNSKNTALGKITRVNIHGLK